MIFEVELKSVTLEMGVEPACEREHALRNELSLSLWGLLNTFSNDVSHLIWKAACWMIDGMTAASISSALTHSWSASPILIALTRHRSTVPWDGLTWVGNDISRPTCSWSARRPEWPSHWRTDFVSPLIEMNFFSALKASWFAERSGTVMAPDIEDTVSTNVSTLRFWTSPGTLSLLTHIFFFLLLWLSQPSFWVEFEVNLRNDLSCWLRIKDGVFWVVPFEYWPFDIARDESRTTRPEA